MKKLFKCKRGISPVISTVLMIMVVMVGMTVLFAFLATYAQGFQNGSGSSVKESMTIEDIWFKSPHTVEIWVYNTGIINFTISNIYLNGTLIPSDSVAMSPTDIKVGAHADITITVPTSWISLDKYTFKLVTTRGSALVETFSPGN
jgi:flagellin-like protein